MATPSIPQQSGYEIHASFRAHGRPTVPSSSTAHWKLTCNETNAVLQDWTAVTVQQNLDGITLEDCYVLVEVPGTLLTMQTTLRERERKTVTVAADKGTAREFNKDYPFDIVRGSR